MHCPTCHIMFDTYVKPKIFKTILEVGLREFPESWKISIYEQAAEASAKALQKNKNDKPPSGSRHRSVKRGFGMAEYGEWNRKGATLSDVTAETEYGVGRDFIVKGIRSGKLEYRDGVIWGNPYLRILRSQLETYIAEELGKDYLARIKAQTKLRKTNKEISDLKKKLKVLQARKAELEESLKTTDH